MPRKVLFYSLGLVVALVMFFIFHEKNSPQVIATPVISGGTKSTFKRNTNSLDVFVPAPVSKNEVKDLSLHQKSNKPLIPTINDSLYENLILKAVHDFEKSLIREDFSLPTLNDRENYRRAVVLRRPTDEELKTLRESLDKMALNEINSNDTNVKYMYNEEVLRKIFEYTGEFKIIESLSVKNVQHGTNEVYYFESDVNELALNYDDFGAVISISKSSSKSHYRPFDFHSWRASHLFAIK